MPVSTSSRSAFFVRRQLNWAIAIASAVSLVSCQLPSKTTKTLINNAKSNCRAFAAEAPGVTKKSSSENPVNKSVDCLKQFDQALQVVSKIPDGAERDRLTSIINCANSHKPELGKGS